MKAKLSNTVSVVFGGNGDIGGAISKGLCKAGALVIPLGRNIPRLKKIIAELKKFGNDWDDVLPVDICNEKQVKDIVARIIKKTKRIDSMVCASGVYLNKPAENMTAKDWDSVVGTNLTANFTVCREVGKVMLEQKKGSIITIGSLGSFVALSGTLAYSVSKAGVVSMTQCLASEWTEKGVRVNSIIPGVFPTKLNKKALTKPGRLDNILKGIPAKRLGNLEELSGAAVFLASDESSYISGISMPVDGGFLGFSGY